MKSVAPRGHWFKTELRSGQHPLDISCPTCTNVFSVHWGPPRTKTTDNDPSGNAVTLPPSIPRSPIPDESVAIESGGGGDFGGGNASDDY